MTVQELYDWAVKNQAENYDIEIQHRDDGGYYSGVDDCDYPEICARTHVYNTEQVVCL